MFNEKGKTEVLPFLDRDMSKTATLGHLGLYAVIPPKTWTAFQWVDLFDLP